MGNPFYFQFPMFFRVLMCHLFLALFVVFVFVLLRRCVRCLCCRSKSSEADVEEEEFEVDVEKQPIKMSGLVIIGSKVNPNTDSGVVLGVPVVSGVNDLGAPLLGRGQANLV